MARHNRRRVNPSRHRSARYGYTGYTNPAPARGCQLQLLELAWPAAVCHCLSVLASQQQPTSFWPLSVCVCVWMELMPNRIYITEPPFSCCFYCSCCDKCYRCLSLSLVAFSFSGFTHQFNWKASAGLSLPHFVICLLAICHFFSLSPQAAASSWLFN